MVKTVKVDSLYEVRYKNVHSDQKLDSNKALKPVHQPSGVLLLDVLKTLEHEIRNRHLLPSSHLDFSCFHPLWFQAETERNVFLWRAGFSLIEKDEFEFWVDVPALIQKRLSTLNKPSTDSPFSNGIWPKNDSDSVNQAINSEKQYLTELAQIFDSISDHATALCEVSTMVMQEICRSYSPHASVTLPVRIQKR
jgi:hypothetical protein